VVLALNLALVAGLAAAGAGAHSLAVLAEGGDYLLDAAGVGVALVAIRFSARPASRARPEGHPNATSIAALINGCSQPNCLSPAQRPAGCSPSRHPWTALPVLVVSGIAALVMGARALILRNDAAEDGTGERDRPLRRSCSTRPQTPLPPQVWPRRARSSW